MLALWMSLAVGQQYVAPPEPERRYSFAEMFVGAAGRTSFTSIPDTVQGGRETAVLTRPSLRIGGTHFWGHADIYVDFALPVTLRDGGPSTGGRIVSSVETGVSLYPWALREGTVRPFAFAGWIPTAYVQSDPELGRGPVWERHTANVGGGFSWRAGPHAVRLLGSVAPLVIDYPTNREQVEPLSLWPVSVGLVYDLHFDTTRGNQYPVESGGDERLWQRMKDDKSLSAFFVAIGPSSAFTLGADGGTLTWAGGPSTAIMPDIGLGMYLHKSELDVRVSYRRIGQSSRGYGMQRSWRRHAVSLEAVRFLADYHGFVPFAGLGVSVNALRYDNPVDGPHHTVQPTPELVFGWDIRPTNTQLFILRTNLRAAPFLQSERASFRHLEFNFIQLVLYPQRVASLR